MLNELDKTLKKLLAREVTGLEEEAIHFDVPNDQFFPTLPAINLFLYDVRENQELRSKEWLLERQSNGQIMKTPAPVRVDCSYLITAWAGDVDNEHSLLGDVMVALLRHPTLPAAVLQGRLQQQDLPPPTTALRPGRLQSLAEFWQALGGKPKAALNFMVTIAVQPHQAVAAGPAIVEAHIPGLRGQ